MRRNRTAPVVVKQEKTIKQEKASGTTHNGVDSKGKGRLYDVPSRSPTPPCNVVQRGRKNAYTPEDREFLIRYAKYRLNEDPHLKKLDIAAELARKVRRSFVLCLVYHGGSPIV